MLARFLISLLFLLVWTSVSIAPLFAKNANNEDQIDFILKMKTPPFGVVFEVIEGSGSALKWAIPKITKLSKRLRDRFPDIGIAVVSHGSELFGLTKDKQKKFPAIHKQVKSLSMDQDIPVHICGTHASWYQKGEKDFPDYIHVAPSGPTEISNYEEMGYELIVLEK
jgi:intracellular sulfur oxidation DsrE/DsrF family protein